MAVPLTYDTLPPHSTLRREINGGMIKITAVAEEPPARARKVELQRAAFSGAMLCSALLAALVVAVSSTYFAHRRYMGSGLFAVLCVAFIVFCAALFAFAWRAQYATRLQVLERAFRQTTILDVTPARLLIETAGTLGQASSDITVDEISRLEHGESEGLNCLEIGLSNGRGHKLFAGRDRAEVEWIIRSVRNTLNQQDRLS